MVGNENADVFLFQFVNNFLNVFNGNRVDSCKGFVEHDELWVYGEAPCNLGSTTLATRKAVSEVVSYFLKIKFFDKAFKLFALILGRGIGHFKNGANIVFDAKFTKYRSFLGEIPDSGTRALVNGVFCDVVVAKEYFPFIRGYQTNGHVKSCGFSSAVGTEQTYDFTLPDVYGNVVYDGSLSVFFDEVFGSQYGRFRVLDCRCIGRRSMRLIVDVLAHCEVSLSCRGVCITDSAGYVVGQYVYSHSVIATLRHDEVGKPFCRLDIHLVHGF